MARAAGALGRADRDEGPVMAKKTRLWLVMYVCCPLMIACGPVFLVAGITTSSTPTIVGGALVSLALIPLGIALFLTMRAEQTHERALLAHGIAGSALIVAVEPCGCDGATRHTLTLGVSIPGQNSFTTTHPWGALGDLRQGSRIAVTVNPQTGFLRPKP